jgi:hypothetical protein
MRRIRYILVLLLLCTLTALMPGWAIRVADAAVAEKVFASSEEVEGRGEGFQPEGKEESKEEGKTEGKEGKQEEAKENECPTTFGPIITDTAIPIEKGKFAIQPTFAVGFLSGVFNRNWHPVSAGGNFTSFQMYWRFTYGLINNMEVYVVIPYIHKWVSDVDVPGPRGERSSDFGGLGDIDLTVKYRLVEEGPGKPTVTALFATDFPTGHFKHLNPRFLGADALGGGAFIFTTGLNISKCLDPFVLYGNFWYSMSTAFSDDEMRRYPRDFVTVNLAGEYVLSKNKKWVALVELTSFFDGGRLIGRKANVPPQALVSVLPGIEYMATEKLSFAMGLNVDFMGKSYPANITPVLSMVYQF